MCMILLCQLDASFHEFVASSTDGNNLFRPLVTVRPSNSISDIGSLEVLGTTLGRKVDEDRIALDLATYAPVSTTASVSSAVSVSSRNLGFVVAIAGGLNDTQAVWMVGI